MKNCFVKLADSNIITTLFILPIYDTDEERLFGVVEEGEVDVSVASSHDYQQWEQFAAVATNLLEKIEQYLESLQAFSDNL